MENEQLLHIFGCYTFSNGEAPLYRGGRSFVIVGGNVKKRELGVLLMRDITLAAIT